MVTELKKDGVKVLFESFMAERSLNSLAALIYGPHAGGYGDERASVNVLAIVKSSEPILKCCSKYFNSIKLRFLIADKETFESDVEREQLGGILAETLITPYEPLLNESYLWDQEIKVKKRVVDNILRNLILSFPEMSRVFIIKPEYFMLETMRRRASLFPLTIYKFLNVTRRDLRERNYLLMMKGFMEALRNLADEGKVNVFDGAFKISDKYIESFLKRKIAWRLTRLFKNARIKILHQVLKVLPGIVNPLIDDYRIYRKYVANYKADKKLKLRLEDPKRYILIPTSFGMIPFTEKVTIDEFLKKYMSKKYVLKHEIKRLGGVLNSVYLLRIFDGEREEKIVVKIFKDWYGWKWFPLALWTLGTKDFAILGRSRLEREYALSTFLLENGINVPKIIYAFPKEKILFQEFVDGTSLSKVIPFLLKDKRGSGSKAELLKVIRQVGGEIARIHSLDVAIGDCKPENILLASDGRIFFVDLEQAERGGDQSWDIAEFLYYLGHYASFSSFKRVEEVVSEFIRGYLEYGGKADIVKRVSSPRYIKVFGVFMPPHIIFAISDACKKALRSGMAASQSNVAEYKIRSVSRGI